MVERRTRDGIRLADDATKFGEYVLHERLGQGGMAETFVASRRMVFDAEPRVCLKRILPGLCDEPSLRRMFFLEAKLSAQLHHVNIVRVIDFGEVSGTAFLVLELVDGTDLRRLITMATRRGEPLEASVITEVAFAIGSALDFANAADEDGAPHGIVHRDVSPSNILVGTNGDVKLADFGIAKAVGQSIHTRTGTLKGKIPYMPPEYALEGKYDARSDLFALGVTLYEACAGVRPFQGGNDVETLERITRGAFVPLSSRADIALPDALKAAVDKLLSRDPEDRFANAGAFVAAIANIADSPDGRTRLAERTRAAQAAKRLRESQRPKTEAVPEPTAIVSPQPKHVETAIVSASPDDVTRTRPSR